MIKKILIANRGEVACRIIRTCKKMAIKTVAVYSEADKDALHTKLADEAYHIGGARVHESYLNQTRIIEVAKESGADAVHPGYGLLSEQADFATFCTVEGLIFIGPNATTIAAMGDKLQARETMVKAGVPVIPGSSAVTTKEEAVQVAQEMGYPVMLKAASGGGGIGIELCEDEEACALAYERTLKKAQMFFGDGAIFIEKYIVRPRHIEMQIVADQPGNVVILGERDCSIQRRHQKVVEEAPSPFLTNETREKMIAMAKQAATFIGYENVGTLECLVAENGDFYFLEMNTRLQVEHPVTEEIFGIDLVEWQIRIAAGEVLPWAQKDLQPEGHALEVRIYAEDPVKFFPSPGTIATFKQPEAPDIRHECPVGAGSVITPFYDPMIAKMIVKKATRTEACEAMAEALAAYDITGIKTNIPLLKEIVAHPIFCAGEATTSFLNTHAKDFVLEKKTSPSES
ncbi:acetyl-CoA carboxylase biotin carboxylase subunit [Shouchella lonarensis]|uniref:biotin carboxylase n=1 Tax=Shouchella lonarensis TaxID=1464122 RepID=A0A1G6JWX2_9BACI|nr:acetyl-CoA carboxylase biotin carboxylase subunit [Shouchella lonarensis]SDC23230.1 acetyl-CoA carboxylase, biotin carboxylase subunit [Shouchella lonarensis]